MARAPILRSIVLGAALAAAFSLAACDAPTEGGKTCKAMEERMREIEKRVKDSMPKTQAVALAQKPDPAVVKKAQADLRVLREYLDDPPSGKIDMVTVNAMEGFQRRAGLRDDGLLEAETVRRLDEAARRAK